MYEDTQGIFITKKHSGPEGAVCRYAVSPCDCTYRVNQTVPFGFFI